ncbi:lipase class 3 [Fibrella aestuarina BUZ 2]|uniref:Lipase class 3 n=1 Tax=Fibrella aestuarina BUZ 2 TaxID=1166018 RepID=I0K9M1_9BACT|nr:META domain-containing protein [Fibrella aestuarina]CCH00824.1 lipase class 3 [Fibrella aestuarina BUZ 2]
MKRMALAFTTCLTALAGLLVLTSAPAQSLQSGFDKAEYIELLKVSAQFGDSTYIANFPKPQRFKPVYRAAVVGLDNLWDLWSDGGNTAVINLRGTTANSASWLANFYAAMVPAKGELQLADNDRFTYHLADNPRAAVHVGWLVGMAFLSRDILPKLDSSYRRGTRNVLIMGHSQGGAIAYLLTAHLYNLQRQGKLPADIRFKTYCSAGPKPGNLYFAYDYEALTQAGWAYNVVNSADWVPEVPFSIQTVNDMNTTNPFAGADQTIKKQPFLKRLVLRKVYNDLSKPALQAQKNYQKYLGNVASRTVKKSLNGYVAPDYYNSNHYVRTGAMVVLLADSTYYHRFPDSADKVFTHHFHPPYLYLAENNLSAPGVVANAPGPAPAGNWELTYLMDTGTDLTTLYPDKKPTLLIEPANERVSGTTGCNRFTMPVQFTNGSIRIPKAFALTRMQCPGDGERRFLDSLQRVNRYALANDTLTLLTDDVAVMRFTRR